MKKLEEGFCHGPLVLEGGEVRGPATGEDLDRVRAPLGSRNPSKMLHMSHSLNCFKGLYMGVYILDNYKGY